MMLIIPVVAVFLMAMAARRRHGDMAATAGILVANWAINSALCAAVGDPFPWLVFMITDYLCGMVIFVVMSSRWQRGVIALFVIMELIHAGYGRSAQDEWANYVYWWALFWAALMQVGLVGGWMVSDMVGRRPRTLRRARSHEALAREGDVP